MFCKQGPRDHRRERDSSKSQHTQHPELMLLPLTPPPLVSVRRTLPTPLTLTTSCQSIHSILLFLLLSLAFLSLSVALTHTTAAAERPQCGHADVLVCLHRVAVKHTSNSRRRRRKACFPYPLSLSVSVCVADERASACESEQRERESERVCQ